MLINLIIQTAVYHQNSFFFFFFFFFLLHFLVNIGRWCLVLCLLVCLTHLFVSFVWSRQNHLDPGCCLCLLLGFIILQNLLVLYPRRKGVRKNLPAGYLETPHSFVELLRKWANSCCPAVIFSSFDMPNKIHLKLFFYGQIFFFFFFLIFEEILLLKYLLMKPKNL